VHQTISHAHTVRFVDGQLFERLFIRSVALCGEHDLLDGTHLSVDGFHAEANAALASLRASLKLVAAPEPEPIGKDGDDVDGGDDDGGQPTPRSPGDAPQLSLVEPRWGPTPRRRSFNATSSSRSDPDAKLRGKPGQRPHLVHRGQIAVDPKARCIVACRGERADGHEGDALAPLVDRARFVCRQLVLVGADQGFAAERACGASSKSAAWTRSCLRSAQCCSRTAGPRPTLSARRWAPASAATPTGGVWAHKRRMADAEGAVAELKDCHALDRARCRGTPLFHVQLLLGCTALNLKRLAAHADATDSQAAGPQTGQIVALGAPGGAPHRPHNDLQAPITPPAARHHPMCGLAAATRSASASLN